MIVGNAGSIILDRNASRMQFEKQRDNAKNYMKIHNVPGGLQRRVLKWYDYSWSRGRMGGGGGDLKSLHLLPDKMKTEIALHVHLETLKKVTFLQNCEREFLHELLLKMKLHIFTPGDLIIRHGEIAREMYLIAHGRIEVISETGKVLKELGSGDFFGEIGILSLSEGQNRRTADVRSIGYTECFVLSKDDVLGEIQQFPEAQRILAEYGKKRLQNTSGDPRLVKLDGQDAPQNKTSSPPERSHVVDVDQSVKYIDKSEKNRLKLSNDGREKDLSQDQRGRTLSALMKSTKDLMIPALVNRNSNVSRSWETGLEDRCRRDFNIGACDPDMCCSSDSNSSCSHDSNTCKARDLNSCATHDLYFCLNTLDTLKAALQNTIENEVKKHKRYISRLECDLELEKERNHLAEQEATMQKDEISALTNANTILQQSIIERDKRISELEYAIQRKFKKHVNETRQGCDTRASEIETEKNERVLLDDDLDSLNVGPRPSPTDGNLTIRDTAC